MSPAFYCFPIDRIVQKRRSENYRRSGHTLFEASILPTSPASFAERVERKPKSAVSSDTESVRAIEDDVL